MGKAELRQRISDLESENRSLEASRSSYQKMNTQINDVIDKLTSAKKSANNSYTELDKYYQSNASSKKVKEIENEHTNIDNLIRILKSEILAASNNKINSINSKISSNNSTIGSLREEIRRIEEEERREREERERQEREAARQNAAKKANSKK